jgi:hypothetical protein
MGGDRGWLGWSPLQYLPEQLRRYGKCEPAISQIFLGYNIHPFPRKRDAADFHEAALPTAGHRDFFIYIFNP